MKRELSPSPSLSRGDAPSSSPLRTHIFLFLLTTLSVFYTGLDHTKTFSKTSIFSGLEFAASLMSILLAHEFGHYIAARLHKVEASLPYFIPLPVLSPFGTMGAIIRMKATISDRKALLDIGAAGPLAGMVLAVPLYFYGLKRSSIVYVGDTEGIQLGSSIGLKFIEKLAVRPLLLGEDILLSPMAYAGWVGLFVTMINLIPVSQLDGGHVAYALFGPKQNRFAIFVHRLMLLLFLAPLVLGLIHDLRHGYGLFYFASYIEPSLFWFVWFEMLAIFGSLSRLEGRLDSQKNTNDSAGRKTQNLPIGVRIFSVFGLIVLAQLANESHNTWIVLSWIIVLCTILALEIGWGTLRPHTLLHHPETSNEALGLGRNLLAIFTLSLFILLFMPTPMSF